MLKHRGYFAAIEPGASRGRVAGIKDVVTFEGETYADLERAFRGSVDDYLEFCAELGVQPERPT